jgi:bifunctional UDP-N-acetylglucosamine pyrophosphorylase / glucosamine-1-phosphate N-acetyltransferase
MGGTTGPAGAPGTTVALVLAAGLGTRMRSRIPKVLHPLLGRPMLAYVLSAAEEATGTRPVVVYSPPTDTVREAFSGVADFVLQDEPRGTGDAVRAAVAALPETVADVVVLSGDVPLVAPELIAELAEARRADGAVMTLVTFEAIDPGRLGRVIRDPDDEDGVLRIVEAKDATAAELGGDLCLRRLVAARPHRRPAPVAGHRRAVPDGACRPRRFGPPPCHRHAGG